MKPRGAFRGALLFPNGRALGLPRIGVRPDQDNGKPLPRPQIRGREAVVLHDVDLLEQRCPLRHHLESALRAALDAVDIVVRQLRVGEEGYAVEQRQLKPRLL